MLTHSPEGSFLTIGSQQEHKKTLWKEGNDCRKFPLEMLYATGPKSDKDCTLYIVRENGMLAGKPSPMAE